MGPAWEIRASQPHELFTSTASSGSEAALGAEIAPSRGAWVKWEEGPWGKAWTIEGSSCGAGEQLEEGRTVLSWETV